MIPFKQQGSTVCNGTRGKWCKVGKRTAFNCMSKSLQGFNMSQGVNSRTCLVAAGGRLMLPYAGPTPSAQPRPAFPAAGPGPGPQLLHWRLFLAIVMRPEQAMLC